MTCEEFHRLTNTDPRLVSLTEVLAVGRHSRSCPACLARLKVESAAAGLFLTAAEKRRSGAMARAMVRAAKRLARIDPEA